MNTNCFPRLLLISIFALLSFTGFCQLTAVRPTLKAYRQQLGFVMAEGVHTGYTLPATYVYKPKLFLLEWQHRLSKKEKWIKLDYVLQPQFNVVRYKDSLLYRSVKEYIQGWEAGININLLLHAVLFYNANTGKGGEVYLQGGSGPHYVSSAPGRQARGFIFSDNIVVGFRASLTRHLLFDIWGGLRHLSNASLKRPNLGLDNVMVGAGFRLLR